MECEIKGKGKGVVLYSAVSSPLDRSKRFTLSSPGRPVHSDTVLGFSWKITRENNCCIGWGESRELNGREQERTTVALVGGESREWNGREQLWHWLGRE